MLSVPASAERLTDVRKFTGTHKQRFDEDTGEARANAKAFVFLPRHANLVAVGPIKFQDRRLAGFPRLCALCDVALRTHRAHTRGNPAKKYVWKLNYGGPAAARLAWQYPCAFAASRHGHLADEPC